MNRELTFLSELNDDRVEQLLAYASYTDNSFENIKSKTKQKAFSKRISGVKRLFIVAAILILGVGAVVAVTVDLDRTYQFLFGTQAEFVYDHGYHLGLVVEAAGIEVELVSVMRYEHELLVIIAVRDTAGNRIDPMTAYGVLLEYTQNGIKNALQSGEWMPSFDDASGTYVMVIEFATPKDADIEELTLTVWSMLSGFMWIDEIEHDIDLYDIMSNHTPTIIPGDAINPTHLKFDEIRIPFSGFDWTYISNIGFVDGRLHIQVQNESQVLSFQPRRMRKAQITPWLVDSYGTTHGRQMGTGQTNRVYLSGGYYLEYYFHHITDVEQLKGMTLGKLGQGFTELIDEEWVFTFALPDEMDSLTISINEKMPVSINQELFAEKILITPLFINMTFLSEDANNFRFHSNSVLDQWHYITYTDGTTVPFMFNSGGPRLHDLNNQERREINLRHTRRGYLADWGIDRAIEIDRIRSITIQGMEFKVDR